MPCGQAPDDDEIEDLLKKSDSEISKTTRSQIVKINNEFFIEPDLTELFPCLVKYCSDSINDYHCQNLYRILFKCANNDNKSKYFKKLTKCT